MKLCFFLLLDVPTGKGCLTGVSTTQSGEHTEAGYRFTALLLLLQRVAMRTKFAHLGFLFFFAFFSSRLPGRLRYDINAHRLEWWNLKKSVLYFYFFSFSFQYPSRDLLPSSYRDWTITYLRTFTDLFFLHSYPSIYPTDQLTT